MMMLHVTKNMRAREERRKRKRENEKKRELERSRDICHQPYNAALSFLSLQEATGLGLPDVTPRSGSSS